MVVDLHTSCPFLPQGFAAKWLCLEPPPCQGHQISPSSNCRLQPSGRACPLAPSQCSPARCWGRYGVFPSLRRLIAQLGSLEQLDAPSPAARRLPRASVSPFPIALCSGDLAACSHPASLALSPGFCYPGPAFHSVYHRSSAPLALGARHGQGISARPPWPWPQRQADLPSQPSPRDAISSVMLAAGHY